MLDRDRGSIRDELEQLDVVVGEVPRSQRPDMKDADHGPFDVHGHAEAVIDVLVAADRRAGDELVPVRVEQEHGTGVDVEDLARPREQRREQLVQLEVREGRVGDQLELRDPRVPAREDHSGVVPVNSNRNQLVARSANGEQPPGVGRVALDLPAHPLGDERRLLDIAFRQHHDELIAAVARHHIRIAHA